MAFNKSNRRRKIRYKIRKKIQGTSDRPRLAVYRSNKGIYAQLIDDSVGHTLLSVSSKGITDGNKVSVAKSVGQKMGEKAKSAGFQEVVFDRSGYLYHGRIKALAEGAGEAGLVF